MNFNAKCSEFLDMRADVRAVGDDANMPREQKIETLRRALTLLDDITAAGFAERSIYSVLVGSMTYVGSMVIRGLLPE
jgi:hypothetical protein